MAEEPHWHLRQLPGQRTRIPASSEEQLRCQGVWRSLGRYVAMALCSCSRELTFVI